MRTKLTRLTILKSVLVLILVLLLSYCGRSPDSKFYSLSGISGHTIGRGNIGLGVGPVRIARYLNQPQIVTRKSANQLFLSEFHRWAAPLQDDIKRVLVSDLQIMLNSNHVYAFPTKENVPVSWQVVVNITEFDTLNNGLSRLRAHWQLFRYPKRCLVMSKSSYFTTPTSGKWSYDKVVAIMSRNLTDLSYAIAQNVKLAARRHYDCQRS